jgi:hypothetical protein
MSTPFVDIYSLNDVIKTDSRLMNKPTNLRYQLYYKYLLFAISYFNDDCYKDIDTHTPFSQKEYSFVGNGVINSFVLDEAPPENCLFYISVNNSSNGYLYSYNEETLTMNITPTPPNSSDIYVAGYIIGEFSANLNIKEKMILVEGMCVPWYEEFKNRNNLLQQAVYGSDFKRTSQAEHIKQLSISTDNHYWKNVKAKINEYTWKSNPDNLLGLGGGLI